MPATTDTSPEIAEMVRTRIMARSGSERFVMGVKMCNAGRRMVPANLSETECKQRRLQRFYSDTPPFSTTEDVRKYAAEQAISEEEALQRGLEEKAAEFAEKGSELYAKA